VPWITIRTDLTLARYASLPYGVPMTPPELMTTPQAAAVLKKSTRTVHRFRLAGEITPVMIVGTGPNAAFLFAREDVDALKARLGERKTASAA
jgi:hypothetical protein